MRIVIIGRSELLFNTALELVKKGYKIPLIITAKEAPEYKKTSKDFENLANEIGADFISTSKLTSENLFDFYSRHQPFDLGVSINYSGIIPQSVIDYFRIGILNVHGGDLPRYRGNACQAWAIINCESKIGLCVHKMVGGELDSGDIIERSFLEININTRIGEVYEWMNSLCPIIILNAVEKLDQNPNYVLEVQSKNPLDALRCYPRKPEDGRIIWSNSAESIIRLINASSEPYSGAYAFFKGEVIKIWRAELYFDEENYLAIPGQILKIYNNGDVIVAVGNGKIIVSDAQIDRRREKPGFFLKSLRDRFG